MEGGVSDGGLLVQILSTNNTDKTITVLIGGRGGKKYEYWIKDSFDPTEFTVRMLVRKQAYGKAIQLLEKCSRQVDKLSLVCILVRTPNK